MPSWVAGRANPANVFGSCTLLAAYQYQLPDNRLAHVAKVKAVSPLPDTILQPREEVAEYAYAVSVNNHYIVVRGNQARSGHIQPPGCHENSMHQDCNQPLGCF